MRAQLRSLFLLGPLAALSIGLIWWFQGAASVEEGVVETGSLLIEVVPQLAMGLLIAGFLSVLVPRERIAALLGAESRVKGLILATAIGSLLPGGPFASFPLVYGLYRAGADIGALIALLVAWATVGVHRLIIWEIPFMGVEFGLLRLISSLPLPIIAGLIARRLVARHPALSPQEP